VEAAVKPDDDKPMLALRDAYEATPEDRSRIWAKIHAAASSGSPPEPTLQAPRGLWRAVAPAAVVVALAVAGLEYGQRAEAQGEGEPARGMASTAVASASASPPSTPADDGLSARDEADEPAVQGTPVSALPSVAIVDDSPARPSRPPAPIRPAASEPSPAPSSTTSPSPHVDALEEETRLLTSAMRASDGTRALALLEEHEARFPRGVLANERDVQRILTLCSLGRIDEARGRAKPFLAGRAPDALTRRVEESCARR